MTQYQVDWMVQVWDAGDGFTDYWPISVYSTKRSAAVRKGPAVFCGEYAERYKARKLRWRIERKLGQHSVPK